MNVIPVMVANIVLVRVPSERGVLDAPNHVTVKMEPTVTRNSVHVSVQVDFKENDAKNHVPTINGAQIA